MIKRGKAEKSAARGERLSAALRENLKRRKAQARERDMKRDAERCLARNRASGADSAEKDATTEPPAPEFHRNPGPE
jgi:hypothetical protein